MTAYVVANFTIRDAEKMDAYAAAAGPTLTAHRGEFLLDGHLQEALFGNWAGANVALVRFPSIEAARKWYSSPEYKALAGLRSSAAEMNIALFQAG